MCHRVSPIYILYLIILLSLTPSKYFANVCFLYKMEKYKKCIFFKLKLHCGRKHSRKLAIFWYGSSVFAVVDTTAPLSNAPFLSGKKQQSHSDEPLINNVLSNKQGLTVLFF